MTGVTGGRYAPDMARRRTDGGAITFDLDDGVQDDEVRGWVGDEPPSEAGRGAAGARLDVAAARDWVAGRRRVLVPVVAGLAALCLVGAGVGTARENERVELLLATPGGVRSLERPPEEVWRTSAPLANVGRLGGDLYSVEEDQVRAVDLDTGDAAWTVPLDRPRCGGAGPFQRDALPATDRLTCLTGATEAPTAVVIEAGGVVSDPVVVDPGDGKAFPGPDGTVAVARRVGPPADPGDADIECSPDSCTASGAVGRVRDVEVTLLDGLTGDVRWTREVRSATASANFERGLGAGLWDCQDWDVSALGVATAAGGLDLDSFTVVGSPGMLALTGCGVRATWTVDGVLLGQGTGPWDLGAAAVPGGYVTTGPDGLPQTFVGPDGEVLHEADGTILVPASGDGSDRGLHLVGGGGRLSAFDARWEQLWQVEQIVESILTVADGVVVGATRSAAFGLDAATGDLLWTWSVPTEVTTHDGGELITSGGYVDAAVTDGHRLLVLTLPEAWDGDEPGAVGHALDLGTGAVEWTEPLSGHVALATEGHLLMVEQGEGQADGTWAVDLVALG